MNANTKIETLRDLAVLISLSQTGYSPRVMDKAETRKLIASKGAQAGSAKVIRDILTGTKAADVLSKISTAQGELRKLYYSKSLPWDDKGRRMASNEAAYTLVQEMRAKADAVTQLANDFAEAWKTASTEAQAALNGFWKAEDYKASPQEMRDKFTAKFELEPVPHAPDLRISAPDAVMSQIVQAAEQAIADKFKAGCMDAYKRLYECVEAIHARASIPTDKENTKDTIRAHLQNLSDLVAVLPALNIAKDPQLTKLATDAKKKFLSLDLPAQLVNAAPPSIEGIARNLKDDKIARATVANQAHTMLTEIRAYMGNQS